MTWANGKAPFYAVHWRPKVRMQSRYYDKFSHALMHWLRLYERKDDLKHLSMDEVKRFGEAWDIRTINDPMAFMAKRGRGISMDDSCHAREERRKAAE